jgi:epoxide hydrolase-like predicted phosphatase
MKDRIKNIIFDLGDVIINIDVPLAAKSFAELTRKPHEEITRLFKDHEVFGLFETGKIDEPGFRNLIRSVIEESHWDDAIIDRAWNSLLLDIPKERIEMLKTLGGKYRLFLLSNTSSIHITEVNEILRREHGVEKLDLLFEKLFLSYEMGVMKPNPAIYHQLLEDAGILAEETLFLDDNTDNIQSAAAIGIHTIHVQKPVSMLDYLKDYVA